MSIQKITGIFASAVLVGCGIEGFGRSSAAIAVPTQDLSAQAAPIELAQATPVCRRILPTPALIRTNGVLLRSQASRNSKLAGVGYAPAEKFDTNLNVRKSSDGLLWLEVTSPRAGWVWAGNGNRNTSPSDLSGSKITNVGVCL
ncbi:hypothetical protein AB3R30_22545 [Leptolyngbyaceae cyanobacterium UHCC 1019]